MMTLIGWAGAGPLPTAFFTPNLLIAIAASPPVEMVLPPISNAVLARRRLCAALSEGGFSSVGHLDPLRVK
jgi:hypothetical protein